MATKVWKGFLNFGMVSIPVYLNTGARDEHVELCFVHTCGSRIKRPDWCPECNRKIERAEINKAYEKGEGEYVVLTKDELDEIAPASEKVMDIQEFVEEAEVDPVYLAESFYLLPDGPGKRGYALLTAALKASGKVAIAQITKNNREHVVLIRPSGHGLTLHALYYPNEVNRVPEFESLPAQEASAADLKLAKQLIESMTTDFKPEHFENGYDMRLNQLIASKLDKAVKAPVPVKAAQPIGLDLTAALTASLKLPTRKISLEKKSPKRRAA